MNTFQPADEQLEAGGTAGFVTRHDLAHVHGICAACGVTDESLLLVGIVPSPAGLDRTKVQLSLKIFLSHRG